MMKVRWMCVLLVLVLTSACAAPAIVGTWGPEDTNAPPGIGFVATSDNKIAMRDENPVAEECIAAGFQAQVDACAEGVWSEKGTGFQIEIPGLFMSEVGGEGEAPQIACECSESQTAYIEVVDGKAIVYDSEKDEPVFSFIRIGSK